MTMAEPYRISTPLSEEKVLSLKSGDSVLINGTIFTGRDAAHRKMYECAAAGKQIPFDVRGQVVYYVDPSPAPAGRVIGSAGPTTSGRMDPFTPALLDMGLRGMIGRGTRSTQVVESMMKNRAVYFGAVGGASALIAKSIVRVDVAAWPELGPEAVFRLEVKDFPVIVVIDAFGNDLYRTEPQKFRKQDRR